MKVDHIMDPKENLKNLLRSKSYHPWSLIDTIIRLESQSRCTHITNQLENAFLNHYGAKEEIKHILRESLRKGNTDISPVKRLNIMKGTILRQT